MIVDKQKSNIDNIKIEVLENILVVEDDEGLSRLIQRSLEKEDFETESALSGADAIANIVNNKSNKNKLLLLDYILPDMTGKQVIETLEQQKLDAPFIIMTGHGDQKIAVEMMKLGARDYIIKDTNFLELLPEVIKRVVNELSQEERLKAAEQALSRSEEKYRTLAENTKDIIYSTNEEGLITYISPQIARYGLAQKEVTSMKIAELGVLDDRERIAANYNKMLTNGEECPTEFRLMTSAGDIYWLEEHSNVLHDDNGRILGVNGILRDITERKHAEEKIKKINEELEERVKQRTAELKKTYEKLKNTREEIQEVCKRKTINALAGGVAHDFNRILSGILNNITNAKSYMNRNDKNFKLLTTSEHGCLQAKNLTQQLLTLSNPGSIRKKYISIGDLMIDSASFMLNGSNIDIDFSIPDNLAPVKIDEPQIKQVINNMLTNAYQAMPNGGIINVRAENIIVGDTDEHIYQLRNGKYVKISIEDSGVGISTENLHRIFDPYFTTRENCKGLGLATSYSIIKNHQGHVTVDSAVNVGSTFSIYLPISQKNIKTQIDFEQNILIGTEPRKILIMDDEELTKELLDKTLARFGYETVFAKDGGEIIEMYKKAKGSENPFKAVIIDLPIPGGRVCKKAIQQLVQLDPRVKAIVSSVYDEDPIMANYKKYGFSGFLAKPYKVDDLGKTLSEVIDGVSGLRG